jgi:antitoxin MazE
MTQVNFETTIQPWGNSLGLRITRVLSEIAHLERGTAVTVEVVKGGLLIKPKRAEKKRIVFPYTEVDLVKGLTPAGAHADELPDPLETETGA